MGFEAVCQKFVGAEIQRYLVGVVDGQTTEIMPFGLTIGTERATALQVLAFFLFLIICADFWAAIYSR